MSRLKLFAVTTIALLTSCMPLATLAADVYVEKHNLNLSGEIRSGDAERMASLIAQEKGIGKFYVNSLGGDFLEAMRMADLVRGLHVAVQVAKGGSCVSACFFPFLEGYERTAFWANEDGMLPPQAKREQFIGVVGIHRPYLKSPTGDVASTQRQEDMMRKVRSYLMSKTLPQHLIDEMMARPSNDIYWLRERDLELVGQYSPGVEEALVSKCGYKRFNQSFNENWSKERRDELDNCTFDYWEEHFFPLQRQFIAKLHTGWRPWKK